MERVPGRWLAIVLVLAFVGYLFGYRWQPERVVERRQQAFSAAIGGSDWDELRSLLAEDYRDGWGFSREEAVLAIRDARLLLLAPRIEAENETLAVDGASGRYQARLRIYAQNDFGGFLNRFNRTRAPFVFTWRKTGRWPWSWQMTGIANRELELPPGYEPGSVQGGLGGL